jgi:DNA repair exonuclease SbcCD ATPase subunit
MRPTFIELKNFGSYLGETEVDLTGMRMVAVTGDNGAGKSTLLDAIVYALTGATRAGAEADAVINDAAGSASVRLSFEMGAKTWRVSRNRVRSKRTVATLEHFDEVQGKWAPVGAEGVKGVDAALAEILGLSSEALLSTAFCTQGDSARFSAAAPKRRKEILAELLGLDRYAPWAAKARDLERAAGATAVALTDAIATTDSALAGRGELEAQMADTVALLGAIEDKMGNLSKQIEKAEGTARAIERLDADISARLRAHAENERAYVTARAQATADLTQAKARLTAAQGALSAAQDAAGRLGTVEAEAEQAEALLASLRADRDAVLNAGAEQRAELDRREMAASRYQEVVTETTARLESLSHADGKVCWTCGQALDELTLQALTKGLEATLAEARSNLATATANVDAARVKRDELLARYKALGPKVAAQEAACKSAGDAVVQARSAASRAQEIANRVADALADVGGATQRLAGIGPAPVLDDTVERLKAERDAMARVLGDGASPLRARYQELSDAAKGYERMVGSLDAKLAALDDLAAAREDKLVQLADARADEAAARACAKAFGPDGIPNIVFAQQASALEAIANEVLGALSEGRMTLELRTTRARPDGAEVGALDVLVTLDHVQRPYGAFSGGERLRIDLALRVALAQLLARRKDARIGMLAIDEGWGALDQTGVADAAAVLRALSEHFELVLTITHQEEVAGAFDSRLEVTRYQGSGSVIERVA